MNLILFCVFLTFSVGLFLLLAGLLHLPTLKTSRVMMDTGKEGKQLSKTLDAFYMDGAVKIAKYIRINDYKKSRMASVLRASGLGMTPEVYTAYAYLKAGSIFLLIIPALYVFPLAALFVILLGIMIYYKESIHDESQYLIRYQIPVCQLRQSDMLGSVINILSCMK